jgi:hypothetical protein
MRCETHKFSSTSSDIPPHVTNWQTSEKSRLPPTSFNRAPPTGSHSAATQTTMATSSQNQGLSKYVTLVSSDGFEFVVLREAACISKAIKKMLDGE